MKTTIVGEEVVGTLGEAYQQDRELKLMSKLMRCSILVIIRHIRVQEGFCCVEGDMNAILGGMGNGTR